jgi:hypothetical protein
MEFLKVYGIDDLHSLPSGIWGIKEPELEWRGTKRLNGLYSIHSLSFDHHETTNGFDSAR